jgi:putative peptidoglycan lipid II flippase
MPSQPYKPVRAAGVVGAATLLSRILGYVRDMVIAYFFGTADAADAFFVAFRIPNLFRRLFAEGSLTVSFIPVFTRYLVQESKKNAYEFASIVFTLLSIVLVLFSCLGIVCSPLIVKIMAWGFVDEKAKYELTVLLTRIMFPYIFFISLVALCMGILNSLKHFAAPALAPVLLNLTMIISVIALMPFFSQPVLALAIGVILGGFLQLALQVPFLKKKGLSLTFNFNFSHPGVKKMAKLMLPAVLGAAVYQLNTMIITMLASFLPAGSVSYLYYSDRIFQFPLALFGISLATALLPAMADQAARNRMEDLKDSLSQGLKLIFFISIPAMAGLIILRVPIVRMLFQRGVFTADATLLTANALFYFTIGLWAVAGVRVVVNVFYALQDIWTPVKVAMLSILCNLVMSVVLMKPLQHAGLALAVSLSSMLNLVVLLSILRIRLGKLGIRKGLSSFAKTIVSSAVMGGAVHFTYHGKFWLGYRLPAHEGIVLMASIVSGVMVFFLCSYLLKSEELLYLWKNARKGKSG